MISKIRIGPMTWGGIALLLWTFAPAAVAVDPPIITSNPEDVTVVEGGSASFNVSVSGTPPFSYQWTWTRLPGPVSFSPPSATGSTYTLSNLQVSDSALYNVRVDNAFGYSSSQYATLTVLPRPVVNDYDGDGKTDVCVYHPPSGTWYISQTTDGNRNQPFGWSEARPVPADYDGDGKTDIAVYHPASGTWYILLSTTGAVRIQPFGWSAAKPVPADYDGDGKADIAVYHAATGTWYILQSSNGAVVVLNWGWSAAMPVPADYDGDGKADIAVYHQAAGDWYIRQSKTSTLRTQSWGWISADPVPGDYDGDGMADIAVNHQSSGGWYILRSSDGGFDMKNWGWSETIAVPGDYDGDSDIEPAVYHPPAGNWYYRPDGREFAWGWGGVLPVYPPIIWDLARPPTITSPAVLPVPWIGEQYQFKFQAVGGEPFYISGTEAVYSWTIQTMGGFPPFGLHLDVNGWLSGIPTAAGARYFTVACTDLRRNFSYRTFYIDVNEPITGTWSGPYSYAFGTNPKYSSSGGTMTLVLTRTGNKVTGGGTQSKTHWRYLPSGSHMGYAPAEGSIRGGTYTPRTFRGTFDGSTTYPGQSTQAWKFDFTASVDVNVITGSFPEFGGTFTLYRQ